VGGIGWPHMHSTKYLQYAVQFSGGAALHATTKYRASKPTGHLNAILDVEIERSQQKTFFKVLHSWVCLKKNTGCAPTHRGRDNGHASAA
jgi:hypothetical protein